MELQFVTITEQNRSAVHRLQVAGGQETFIESVSECLEEADRRRSWRPVGIYDGELLVGFAMYGYFWEYLPFGRVWLDRLLIDQKYQGKGYGKAALEGLVTRLRREYRRRRIYLSVFDDNPVAIRMYQKYGFRFNGELDTHGEKIMVLQPAGMNFKHA